MINLPSKAKVGRIMPKEAFYKNLTLSPEVKEKFVSDVKRLVLEYSLTAESINVDPCEEIKEILVLSVHLKSKSFDYRVIEAIARQNKHKLVFILSYDDSVQTALYYSKLYKSDWVSVKNAEIKLVGRTLNDIWNGLIEQIALTEKNKAIPELSVEERLKRQEQTERLTKDIEKLDRMKKKEIQPKVKFALHEQLQAKKKELEDLQNG